MKSDIIHSLFGLGLHNTHNILSVYKNIQANKASKKLTLGFILRILVPKVYFLTPLLQTRSHVKMPEKIYQPNVERSVFEPNTM